MSQRGDVIRALDRKSTGDLRRMAVGAGWAVGWQDASRDELIAGLCDLLMNPPRPLDDEPDDADARERDAERWAELKNATQGWE